MALGRLTEILKEHPWPSYVLINLVLVLLEKLVEHEFVCPCRRGYTEAFFSLYFIMPMLIALNFGVYLRKTILWSDSETPERCPCLLKGCAKLLTCAVPSFFWLSLFFVDGRYVACLVTPLQEDYVESSANPPREWCDKNRTLTDEQKHVQISFYISKIVIFTFITIILFLTLCHQCLDRQCGRFYGRCCSTYCDQDRVNNCIRCCSTSCLFLDGFCGGYYEANRMKVRCVAKHTIDQWALCSVCDGTTVFLITLEGKQIDELQEGETYIIKDGTVEEDQPYSRIILGSGTAVSGTTPLQIDEKLIRLAKESINPSSDRTALNDPGLYLKQGYMTLSGKVVSPTSVNPSRERTTFSCFRKTYIPIPEKKFVMIEENGVRVPVTLLNEAAEEELASDMDIVITHVKVDKNQSCKKKLTSSYFTDAFNGKILLSPYKVHCVAKRTTDGMTLCSVCDNNTVYLITIKEEQIDKLQEGVTYTIKDYIVKEDQPYSRIILHSGTAVSGTTPLQIDEKFINLAKQSINPSSERTALNDPGLYQKEGYITLTGKVVSRSLVRHYKKHIHVRDVEIEENGVRVSVMLFKEVIAILKINSIIEITYVKVDKNKTLRSSDYTVVSVREE